MQKLNRQKSADNCNYCITEVFKSIRTPPPFFLAHVPFVISPGDLVCGQNSWGNKKRHVGQKNEGGSNWLKNYGKKVFFMFRNTFQLNRASTIYFWRYRFSIGIKRDLKLFSIFGSGRSLGKSLKENIYWGKHWRKFTGGNTRGIFLWFYLNPHSGHVLGLCGRMSLQSPTFA